MKQCKQIQEWMPQAFSQELNQKEQTEFDRHLEQCAPCDKKYKKFRETLDTLSQRTAPDPGNEYWNSFAERLEEKIAAIPNASNSKKYSQKFWINFGYRAMKVAALVTIGIMLGYVFFAMPPDESDSMTTSPRENSGYRMTASVDETTEYLESAKVFLLGIVNLDTENINKSHLDFSMHKDYSRSMIKRTAVLRGSLKGRENRRVIELLNELEIIFLQLANYEQDNDLEAVDLIRGGVEDQAILLKIDVEKLILNSKQESEETLSSEEI